jgi:N-sulfoglucosamine sulfohydrolase
MLKFSIMLLIILFACSMLACGEYEPNTQIECDKLLLPASPTRISPYSKKNDKPYLSLPPVPDNATGLNVLLIITEDHGPQSGAYGTPGVSTPNMDRLAQMGARYSRAYITVASCSPSKSAMYTGLYNHVTGALLNVPEFFGSHEQLQSEKPDWFANQNSIYHQMALKTKEPTLIEILKHAGYFTGINNKFHRSPHTRYPFDRWEKIQKGGPTHYQLVTSFIKEAQKEFKPWFLEHNIQQTHRPWRTPEHLEINKALIEPPGHLPDTETTRLDWSSYLNSIQLADNQVGQILEALEDNGELDNTLIVMTGDHGMPYHRAKFSVYNLGLHVPLFICAPGIKAGMVLDELFSSVDILPTLLEFLGLETVGRVDGVSHYPLLVGISDVTPRNHLVGSFNTDRSITDGRYHLIFMPDPEDTKLSSGSKNVVPWGNAVYAHIIENKATPGFEDAYRLLDLADHNLPEYTRPRFELYDLFYDPWELIDLSKNPDYAKVLYCMQSLLSQWMESYEDKCVGP